MRGTRGAQRSFAVFVFVAFVAFVVSSALSACGNKTPDTAFIAVSGGLDGAAFSDTPTIARVELRTRTADGTERPVGSATPANGGLDVPDSVSSGSDVVALVVAGLGSDGAVLSYGRTPFVDRSAFTSISMTILAPRLGTYTRALQLGHTVQKPLIVDFSSRYLLVLDRAGTSLDRVDMLQWRAGTEPSALESVPVTAASSGDTLLVIDAAGNAVTLVVGASGQTKISPPSGSTFADVVGGSVVIGEDEAAYIVGATRPSGKSDVVLRLATDGTLSARRLLHARSGAAATWITGRGLVVVGGTSGTATELPTPEILAPGATSASPLPFSGDGVEGAVVVAIDGGHVVRVRASGEVETFDFACASACAPTLAAAKAPVVTPSADDSALLLERKSFFGVRGGLPFLLDVGLTQWTALAGSVPTGTNSGALCRTSTGAALWVASGANVAAIIQ